MNTLRFIKLKDIVINASKIVYIERKGPDYKILLDNPGLNGYIFAGSGSIESKQEIITVSTPEEIFAIEKFIKLQN